MGNREDGGSGGGLFIAGLLIGGAIGAAVALLFAPRRGDETREIIKQKTNEYSDTVKSKAGDLSEAAKAKANEFSAKASDVADSVKSKTSEVGESVKARASDLSAKAQSLAERGRSVMNPLKDRLDEAIDAGKQAAHDKEQELKASVETTG